MAELLPFQPLLAPGGWPSTAAAQAPVPMPLPMPQQPGAPGAAGDQRDSGRAGAAGPATPAFLVLRHEFRAEGGLEKGRLGLVAALLPEGDSSSRALAGLETDPLDVERELESMRATGLQEVPIAAVVEDLDFHLEKLLERGIFLRDRPDGHWSSPEGERLRAWRIEDASLIQALESFLACKDLILFDGLPAHRALRRLRDAELDGGPPGRGLPMVAVFNLFDFGVGFSSPIVLVKELPGFSVNAAALRLNADFELKSYPVTEAVRLPRALTDFREDLRVRGFTDSVVGAYFAGTDCFFLFQLREGVDRERVFLPDVPAPLRDLDIVLLRRALLERHLVPPAQPPLELSFCHSAEEAVGLVRGGRYQAAFFVNPPQKRKTAQLIRSGFRLPVKAVRLEPPLPGGLIVKSLLDPVAVRAVKGKR